MLMLLMVSTLNAVVNIEVMGVRLAVTDAKRVKKPKLPKKRLLKKLVKRKSHR